MPNLCPRHIEVFKQWEHIDLWITIDDSYSLIIEDKTGTTEHDDQLSIYKDKAKKWCSENNQRLICCYYKTESFPLIERKNVESKGYAVFERKDVLAVFERFMDTIQSNEVLFSYYQFLKKKEDQENQYTSLAPEKWEWYQHIGFFKALDVLFEEYVDHNWDYVNNPAGGFSGFWWNFRQIINTKVNIYLQFEDHTLCVKIGDVYENHSYFRQLMVERMNNLAGKKQIVLNKPQRYGFGTCMTIGVFDEQAWYSADKDGHIDMNGTKDKLKRLMGFIDELALFDNK